MSDIKNIIKERLEQTQNCDFKKAWIPKGWAVVHVDTFVDELAEKILEKDASVHTTDQDLFLKFLSSKGRIGKYITRLNGTVDVSGDVNLLGMKLKKLPVQFGIVTGNFDCAHNQLTSLQGAPEKVGESFWCTHNQLTSLEGSPEEVGGEFYCSGNPFTSLDDKLSKPPVSPPARLIKESDDKPITTKKRCPFCPPDNHRSKWYYKDEYIVIAEDAKRANTLIAFPIAHIDQHSFLIDKEYENVCVMMIAIAQSLWGIGMDSKFDFNNRTYKHAHLQLIRRC